MKVSKLVTPVIIIASLLVLVCGCSSKAKTSTTTKTITTTVKKGNIALDVTGTGNLAFSETEDLAFDMAGTVENVIVTAGETVTKGQELATLDTSVWDDQIKSLQKTLVNAQRTLVSAERAVSSKRLSLRQAELDIQSAEDALNVIAEVKYAQDAVDNIEAAIVTVQTTYASDPTVLAARLTELNTALVNAKTYLNEVLEGNNISISGDVALQIAKKVLAVDQAKLSLETAQAAIEDANTAVNDAKTAANEAQNDLDDAEALSPVITAPFDGFVTRVNVSGGAEVAKGTIAIQISDPEKFKANIQVTEEDISSIKLGGTATVSIDALNVTYLATITAIAPTATVSSGVVSYKVTVELDTTKTISTSSGSFSSGMTPPSRFSGNMTLPSGFPSTGGSNTTATTPSSSVTLKDGLTATVTITVIQSSNVLLVPTKALTRSGQTYTVQVVNGTTTESRTVVTGNSDDSNTEITSGLSEGETITYTVSSSPSSSSSSSSQSGIGNMGGIGGFSGGGGPPGGF